MAKYLFLLSFFFSYEIGFAQVVLEADGPGGEETYDLITAVLAPGHNPIEVPDCGHEAFGDHIDEIFDNELNTNVFRFFIHTDDDDDRCINFDRQRNEIKTYNQSPDNLLGIVGETVEYKWKFKIDADFQSSPKFTHLHQLKSVGGPESSHPLITLTTRKGSPDQLELRHGETTSSEVVLELDLAPFKGTWCEAIETVTYGENGSFDITIKRVSDDVVLLDYSNNDIRMWRTDADFVRPKWGIYRSLVFEEDLRDEEVLFADFSIEELEEPLPVDLIFFSAKGMKQHIQLNWQTASETNNKGFTIQHSSDGNNWRALDFVEGKGSTLAFSDYEYKHEQPQKGLHYYRLMQVDYDGQFEYSEIRTVQFDGSNIGVALFPNPIKEFINIQVQEDYERGEYRLYDSNGKLVKSAVLDGAQFHQIQVNDLGKGTYFVLVDVDGVELFEKMVVR